MLKKNAGFTIVELVIYLGISVVMLTILGELFGSILNEGSKVQNYSAVQMDGKYILSRLKTHLNNADAVTVPANLGESSSELVLVEGGTTYHYYVINSHLYLNDGSGDYLISDPNTSISNVLFTKTGNPLGKAVILFEFTSSSGVAGTSQYESQTFKGAGGLR